MAHVIIMVGKGRGREKVRKMMVSAEDFCDFA